MAPWLSVLEAYLVQALLRTPAFHRGVEKVARRVHKIRHGTPPEEMGGTNIDAPGNGSFLRHFTEEVQTQLGRQEAKEVETAVKSAAASGGESGGGAAGSGGVRSGVSARRGEEWRTVATEEEGADAAWKVAQKSGGEAPKQGFLGEYTSALREQLKGGR
ncbi:hypothetical protein LTR37_017007 [Vermiconidia calcicola]|uniref:Uncharacterized protein n=1 Tax=Vermiconidia calcicola TaxID=1690605 RepID=A0ACC3MMT1_9PEZI|nr:hypothetical protein LTR37_017007 [Vermiconidia calcicola]